MGVLQFRRGKLSDKPNLKDGEPYYATDENAIYLGNDKLGEQKFVPDDGAKIFRGIIRGADSNGADLIVLRNDFDCNISNSPDDPGAYKIMFEGHSFDPEKTLVRCSPGVSLQVDEGYLVNVYTQVEGGNIMVRFTNGDGWDSADISFAPIEVIEYP